MLTLIILGTLSEFPRRLDGNLLDESLFLYLEFDMNKYLQNWGNKSWRIDYYYDLLIKALCDLALCCNFFVSEFGFSLSWVFYIHDS